MVSVKLPSKEHQELLDVVDKLLPQCRLIQRPSIFVCGDQYAGKSSVVEAISGITFPIADDFRARFVTELVLCRDATPSVKVSMVTGSKVSARERERLHQFAVQLQAANPDIGPPIGEATEAMEPYEERVSGTDIIRIELRGPDQPHFTIVDPPVLKRDGTRRQSFEYEAMFRRMIGCYFGQCTSIILAVVSAKSEFNLQEVKEMARELNLNGPQTMGLITKPDILDVGSDSEEAYVQLAQNKGVVFDLGWHVLKNKDHEMRYATSTERNDAEERFFETRIWADTDSTSGVGSSKG